MNSVVIDIEEDNQRLGNDLWGFSRRLLDFFTGPDFCTDDYADSFLMFVGEDAEVRIPQGKIRGLQNTCSRRIEVMYRCLSDMFTALQTKRPGYTEAEFGVFIDNFLIDGDGYIERKIAVKAQSPPYFGYIARRRELPRQ